MIDFFRAWLPQIIGYAEHIVDETLHKAWVEGDRSQTSVFYSGELYEQVFGDLDSDSMEAEVDQRLEEHPKVASAVHKFLQSLRTLDEWIESNIDVDVWSPAEVATIFESEKWGETQRHALKLVNEGREAGFTSSDFDPTP